MKYFVVFVLALIALFATVQSAAIEESAQVEPEVPAVDTDIPDIPASRLSCQIGGALACSAHCIALHHWGGECKNGVCVCFD